MHSKKTLPSRNLHAAVLRELFVDLGFCADSDSVLADQVVEGLKRKGQDAPHAFTLVRWLSGKPVRPSRMESFLNGLAAAADSAGQQRVHDAAEKLGFSGPGEKGRSKPDNLREVAASLVLRGISLRYRREPDGVLTMKLPEIDAEVPLCSDEAESSRHPVSLVVRDGSRLIRGADLARDALLGALGWPLRPGLLEGDRDLVRVLRRGTDSRVVHIRESSTGASRLALRIAFTHLAREFARRRGPIPLLLSGEDPGDGGRSPLSAWLSDTCPPDTDSILALGALDAAVVLMSNTGDEHPAALRLVEDLRRAGARLVLGWEGPQWRDSEIAGPDESSVTVGTLTDAGVIELIAARDLGLERGELWRRISKDDWSRKLRIPAVLDRFCEATGDGSILSPDLAQAVQGLWPEHAPRHPPLDPTEFAREWVSADDLACAWERLARQGGRLIDWIDEHLSPEDEEILKAA